VDGCKAYFLLAQTARVWLALDKWLRHQLRAIQFKHWRHGPTIYREPRVLGASAELSALLHVCTLPTSKRIHIQMRHELLENSEKFGLFTNEDQAQCGIPMPHRAAVYPCNLNSRGVDLAKEVAAMTLYA